jgi:lysophospholipase L1-like esterase
MSTSRIIVGLSLFCSVAGLTPSVAETNFVPANNSAISYVGRWGAVQTGDRTSMVTVNSSSQIYASFTGRHVAGLFDLDKITCLEQIVVKVDNSGWTLLTLDKPRIDFFPAGLNDGTHHLEIVVKALDEKAARWLTPLQSAVKFHGFELDPGAEIVSETMLQGRARLEFIGDSITQGDGIKGTNAASVMNGDALASYAWLTGESLGTIHAQIAFPGQGVLTSDSREVPPAIMSFGWNFAGSPAELSPAPDFLVVNLGSNDGGIPSNEFVQAYVELLHEIRERCPRTVIFAVRPYSAGDQGNSGIASAVRMLADPDVHYVDSTGWLTEGDFIDHTHLNVAGSRKAATHLEAQLRPYIERWNSEHR